MITNSGCERLQKLIENGGAGGGGGGNPAAIVTYTYEGGIETYTCDKTPAEIIDAVDNGATTIYLDASDSDYHGWAIFIITGVSIAKSGENASVEATKVTYGNLIDQGHPNMTVQTLSISDNGVQARYKYINFGNYA